jgi:hypothetical protein
MWQYTREEAKEHFEWFLTYYEGRIAVLLGYLGESLTSNPKADLLRLGNRLAEVLPGERFSFMPTEGSVIDFGKGRVLREPPMQDLTEDGVSLALDMGCLLGKLMLGISPRFRWKLYTEARTSFDYQWPVVFDRGTREYSNPVGWSPGSCLGVLHGSPRGGPGSWAWDYERMVRVAAATSPEEYKIDQARSSLAGIDSYPEDMREDERKRLLNWIAEQEQSLERKRLKQQERGRSKGKKG